MVKLDLNNVKLTKEEQEKISVLESKAAESLKKISNRQDIGQDEENRIINQRDKAISAVKLEAYLKSLPKSERYEVEKQMELEKLSNSSKRKDREAFEALEARYDQKINDAKWDEIYQNATPEVKKEMKISSEHAVLKGNLEQALSKEKNTSRFDEEKVEKARANTSFHRGKLEAFEQKHGLTARATVKENSYKLLERYSQVANAIISDIKEGKNGKENSISMLSNALENNLKKELAGFVMRNDVVEQGRNKAELTIENAKSILKGAISELSEVEKSINNKMVNNAQGYEKKYSEVMNKANAYEQKLNSKKGLFGRISNFFAGVNKGKVQQLKSEAQQLQNKMTKANDNYNQQKEKYAPTLHKIEQAKATISQAVGNISKAKLMELSLGKESLSKRVSIAKDKVMKQPKVQTKEVSRADRTM